MDSVEGHNYCPHCLKLDLESTLRFVRYGVNTFLRCDDPYCPYNLEGHHVINKPADAPLSKSHVKQLGAPIALLQEPLAKRKHLKLLAWMKKMKTDIYVWMGVEVQKMIEYKGKLSHQSSAECSKFQVSDDVMMLLKLSRADVQVCKYIIPDLELIIRIVRHAYQQYVRDTESNKVTKGISMLSND